jgi:rRNA-processing protein FCF1
MSQSKIKVYLETSVFNWYVNPGESDNFKVFDFFKEIINSKFEPYTSYFVVQELNRAPEPKREIMLNLIPEYNIKTLRRLQNRNRKRVGPEGSIGSINR